MAQEGHEIPEEEMQPAENQGGGELGDVLDEGNLQDELQYDEEAPEEEAVEQNKPNGQNPDSEISHGDGERAAVQEHQEGHEGGQRGDIAVPNAAQEGDGSAPQVESLGKAAMDSPKGDNDQAAGPDKAGKSGGFDPLTRPPHGSEIYLSGIQPDWVEEDLRDFCSKCGEVFEVRIPKEEGTGTNRKFAFVSFTSKEEAERGLQELNGKEIKGRKVRVSKSQSKHRIFIGNLPKQFSKDELLKVLLEEGQGITNFDLLMDKEDSSRNRGYGFLEYFNHACAEAARRNLSRPGFQIGGRPITVNWAESKPEAAAEDAAQQVKVVYVRGLPEGTSEENLKGLLERHGEIEKVVIPAPKPGQRYCNYGFIHFSERSSALAAVEKTETYELEGKSLDVSIARPQVERPQGRGGMQAYTLQPAAAYGAYGGNQRGQQGGRAVPAQLTMVPMTLPDGRIGYVLQQPTVGGGGGAARRGTGMLGSAPQGRRYRPY